MPNHKSVIFCDFLLPAQLEYTCLKSTKERQEKGKYPRKIRPKLTIKTLERLQ